MRHFWRLDKGSYIVGRDKNCDLFIDDETISRKHARLEVSDDESVVITDLESHNGTVINGVKISEPTKMGFDDTIEMGRIELRMSGGDTPLTEKQSPSMIDINRDLTSATMMPLNEALKPLSSKILENPAVFKAVAEIGKMLAVPSQDDEIFGKSLKLLQEVIPMERAAIFLTDELEGDICLSVRSITKDDDSGSFCISRTILREMLDQKKAILISDPQSDTKFAGQQSIIMSKIKSAIAVPLYDEGRVLGILYADTSNPVHRYTPDHLRITATFGNMLAAKMMNNTLLKERREKELMEAELKVASQIQKRLLPASLPEVEGYFIDALQIQCLQVGGDLYDIARLSDGRILILLADVSGKGIGAALLASNILAAFRALYNSRKFDILEAACAVSEQLLAFSRPGDFATMFAGLLDPVNNKFHYVNAGHNPPILARNNGSLEHLEASGIPIGMLPVKNWCEESIEIQPGDSIVIFTDGIPEAADSKGEQFGEEKLEETIQKNREKNPRELLQSILAQVDNFIGDQPQSDDISIIVLNKN